MRKFLVVLTIALAIGTQLSATVTATWDWQHSTPATIASVSYEQTTGSVLSNVSGVTMFVDAMSGKLMAISGYAQFNENTILRIPVVSTLDIVTFVAHPSNYNGVNIGGINYDNSETTRTHTATAAEVAQGYVEIISKGGYVYSVSVDLAYIPATKTIAQWNWKTNVPNGICSITTIEGTTGSVDSDVAGISMYVDATTGKLAANGDNAQFNAGTILQVPVTATTDMVTFVAHSSNYNGVIIGGVVYDNSSTTRTHQTTAAEVAQGYVEITSKGGYIYSVTLEKGNYTPAAIGAYEWATFSDAHNALDFTNLAGVVEAYTITDHEGATITKSDINATVPANTGLLLNAAEGTYAIPFASSSSTDVSLNKLVPGTGASVDAGTGVSRFVLSVANGKAVFKKIESTAATVGVGKAYLEFDGSAPAPSIIRIVDEENGATNIDAIDATEEAVKFFQNGKLYILRAGVVYDALGRMVK